MQRKDEKMESLEESPPTIPSLHQIRMARSVNHPHSVNPEIESMDKEHLETIYKFLNDMNFKDYPDSLSQIHLRPVFESPWYLGPTIIFYAALVGVGIIVNCVIAGDNFTICWNFIIRTSKNKMGVQTSLH